MFLPTTRTAKAPAEIFDLFLRSIREASAEEDGGIEGILSRLEKERNMNLGLGLREKTNTERVLSNTGKSDSLARISLDSVSLVPLIFWHLLASINSFLFLCYGESCG